MVDLLYPIAVNKVGEQDGGGYLAHALDLKGCLGDGATPEEAIANLKDAIVEWIDEARRLKRPIPRPGESLERAHKERLKLVGVIRKQDELISKQAESFGRLRDEIRRLREQVAELADKNDQEDSDQVWWRGAVCQTNAKKDRHGNDGVPH